MPIAFPGYVPTTTALVDRVTADWMNAIRDRALQVFDTAAHRDSAIPSPSVGQTCIITTGSDARVYTYHGATVGWTLPWNLPWGYITKATVSSNQTSIGATVTDVASLTATFTAISTRRYRYSLVVPRIQHISVASDQHIYLTTGGNSVLKRASNYGTPNVTWAADLFATETGVTGSQTRKARASSSLGSMSVLGAVDGAGNGSELVIEDIGPSGAPT